MHRPVLDQAGFGKSPKSLAAIDVGLVCGEHPKWLNRQYHWRDWLVPLLGA